jgi:uncharacterized protein (TIGR02588 family)
MGDERSPGQAAARIPRAEWAVALTGLALVAATIGYMLAVAATERDTPPDIVASVERVHRASGGWVAEIAVDNRGGSTAAEVTIRAALGDGGREVETGEVVLGYVPMHSRRSAAIIFRRDPRAHAIDLRAVSHREP